MVLVSNEDDFAMEFESIPTKRVSRIQMKFTKILQESSLPAKLPPTIVFWNRCETEVNPET